MIDILIKPEEINCNGCKSGISSFGKCQECEIRKCGEIHQVENCAHCKEYSCELLRERHDFDPGNKRVLDEIRIELGID